MSFEQRVTSLGLTLPAPPQPVATYVPSVQVGDLLFVSGVVPSRDGQIVFQGKVGRDLSKEEGYEAAKVSLLNALANVRQAAGSLDQVKRIVKMTGYVASHEGFREQPYVINGASDLLVAIFGEAGRHARAAVGVAELPLGVPVELELIVQLLPDDS
ncbi:MAG: RidA family protein [Nitrospira sp.]|nr:RidA family protein [Nitrospira sp.]